jgi:hypothetical protein
VSRLPKDVKVEIEAVALISLISDNAESKI